LQWDLLIEVAAMSQLNIHVSSAFEQKLKRYMRVRGIKTKSDAVHAAVDEALRLAQKSPTVNLRDLVGAAKQLPLRPRKKWLNEDDLWGSDGN
jgi:hypothetical protein